MNITVIFFKKLKLYYTKKILLYMLLIGSLITLPSIIHAQTLLYDDFPGDIVSSSNWHIPTWVSPTDGTFVGRTQFICTPNPLPAAENNNAIITVQSYNPTQTTAGGPSFYGYDLISNQSFTLGQGIDITVVAKMNTLTPGIVGGIFLYALKPGSTTLHDEIDFELLTDQPDEVQTNIYSDAPLGTGSPQFVSYTSGSITDYHTYEIKWLPNEVSWFIDGNLVWTNTTNVPAGPMNFHLNMWVPGSDWAQAYSANLQPASSASSNQVFSMSVNSIDIQSITAPTAPGAPTGVSATAGNAQATVSFTAPASNGGSPITGYTVTSSPGGKTASGTATTLTVTGLTNGTTYTFTVTATNKIGSGPASSASNPVIPATVPGAPTNVTAAVKAGYADASVSFNLPSNGGSPITGYTATSNPGSFTGTGVGSPITVSSLNYGTAYTFTVKAANGIGNGPASGPSNSVTPYTVPGAPTGVSATAGNAQATVSFTAPASNGGSAITGYTVTSSPGGKTASGTATTLTVTGLTNGTAYTFTVTATNKAGTGPASGASSPAVTPYTVPGAPTIGTVTAGNADATVSFTAPASNGGSAITGYTVTSSPGGKTASGTATTLTVTGLTNGTAYTFTVTATNKAGTGPASGASSPAVTPYTVPGAPTGVSATAGNAQATVSFTAPASNGGSPITGYTVTSSPGGKTASGTATTLTVTGLTNGTAYTFTVTATNKAGSGPASSPSNKVTP